ncbi:MAG: DUF4254 domain-containing protein [Prevotellaceae bacterium]|jgi:hypothetical protein|nr:DUF4254 domain-containing protein [Prevotellaceae bacterium]
MNINTFSQTCTGIFNRAIEQYHTKDDVNASIDNPYPRQSVEYLLFRKNCIDTVQWHLEDIIRKPEIDAAEALLIKRRIDKSNQDRTDIVELIDSYFLDRFKDAVRLPEATVNTESPAWAIDRLSILALKIYHMYMETIRTDADAEHINGCRQKLTVLNEQQSDLSTAINQLLDDIASGKKYMKTYKQMKMYNDPNLNPELYNKNNK